MDDQPHTVFKLIATRNTKQLVQLGAIISLLFVGVGLFTLAKLALCRRDGVSMHDCLAPIGDH